MTPERLDEIQRRADAATKGPWYSKVNHIYLAVTQMTDKPVCNVLGGFNDTTHANVDFIAHARTDVPELVAEVRRLQAENDQLKAVAIEARKSLAVTASNIRSEIKRDAVAASRWEGVPEELEKRASAIDAALSKHGDAT